MIPNKPIEIFCGTGGVGKTTLATSRALHLSLQGKRVLLITIDPAKRLKQVLQIDDDTEGIIHQVSNSKILRDQSSDDTGSFDALLMSPLATLRRVAPNSDTSDDKKFENPILDILSRPNGGMNEILAIVEVQHQLESQKYDTIVLDTPPGKHFIDFLQASSKIQKFFDKSFIDIFRYLGKKTDNEPTKMLTKIFSSGVKKLLSYLEVVTGKEFVDVFIDAISILYGNKETFLKALKFQESLAEQKFSNWFLVTSVDQDKMLEAGSFRGQAIKFMHGDSYLAVNKTLIRQLENWELPDTESDLINLKKSMLTKEQRVQTFARKNFEKVLNFPEVLSTSPADHVEKLCRAWES